MRLAVAVAIGLVGWSLLANLVLGDTLYTTRNVALAVALLAVGRRASMGWDELGLGRAEVGRGIRWGGVAVVIVAVVVVGAVALPDALGPAGALLADERATLTPSELAFHALVRIPLGTALFEEVAFRGLLLAALLRATSRVRATAGSSVAFGLWHVAPTMVTLEINQVAVTSAVGLAAIAAAVVVTTLAGVVFCVLRLASGSLVAPILAHWATNALGLIAAAVTDPVPT